MTNARRHIGIVTKDGGIRFEHRDGWLRALRRLIGKEVAVTVTAVGAERPSHGQHGYYRSTVLPLLAEEWGWGDPAELHYRLKEKHLPAIIPVEDWPYRKIGKEEKRYPPSMADFTMEQASAFLQAVLDQAMDSHIAVPPPRGKAA